MIRDGCEIRDVVEDGGAVIRDGCDTGRDVVEDGGAVIRDGCDTGRV